MDNSVLDTSVDQSPEQTGLAEPRPDKVPESASHSVSEASNTTLRRKTQLNLNTVAYYLAQIRGHIL